MFDAQNPDPSALTQRLEELEASQRRLKRTSFALGGLLAATGLMSFAVPTLCHTVKAERFVLEDAGGNPRIVLNAYGVENPTMTLQDEDGKPVATLQESDGGIELKFFGEKPQTLKLPAKGGVN